MDAPRVDLTGTPEDLPNPVRDNLGFFDSDACLQAVCACFPDIDLDHVKKIGPDHGWDQERVITYILDQIESGHAYPKRQLTRKRKRAPSEDSATPPSQDAQTDYQDTARQNGKDAGYVTRYRKMSRGLLIKSFPEAYAQEVEVVMRNNHNLLYHSYLALEKGLPEGKLYADDNVVGHLRRKKPISRPLTPDPEALAQVSDDPAVQDAYIEYRSIKLVSAEAAARVEEARLLEEKEQLNFEQSRQEGNVKECECCYDEFPMNRMVHCDGDVLHWFCKTCAKQQADTVIGLSKYELKCMSMDQCTSLFAQNQKDLFLDDKTKMALDRIEQDVVLRAAGIEDLAECPFCPYAEVYPPVEQDKEFRCKNPKCEVISCRLCQKPTHIPKSCQEAVQDEGDSARRAIEEAMSSAMIRKCNKCQTPFIKEHGCNKMTCTKPGCHNIQCYVCSKSCEYAHFDDASRGGKKGNCPLFDDVESRHREEVRRAEQEARKRVLEENPELDEKAIEVQASKNVKDDTPSGPKTNGGHAGDARLAAHIDRIRGRAVDRMAGIRRLGLRHAPAGQPVVPPPFPLQPMAPVAGVPVVPPGPFVFYGGEPAGLNADLFGDRLLDAPFAFGNNLGHAFNGLGEVYDGLFGAPQPPQLAAPFLPFMQVPLAPVVLAPAAPQAPMPPQAPIWNHAPPAPPPGMYEPPQLWAPNPPRPNPLLPGLGRYPYPPAPKRRR